jgi:ABC-type multidrug transport system ATPase subunit
MVQQPQQQQKKNDYELMPALFAASDEETAGCGNAMKIVHDNTVIPPVSINHCNKNELLSKRLENRCSSIFSERGGHTLDVEKVFLSTKPKQNGKNKPQTILKGISSSFTPNTVTAIMGPSGSGKTSLLKILTGRLSQKSKLSLNGTIKLDGEVVDPTSINIRKQIAYVEQDVSILPTSTPREAIKFSAR